MLQALTVSPRARLSIGSGARARIPRRPSWGRLVASILVLAMVLAVCTTASTVVHLRLPTPTGSFAVGKAATVWTDPTRPEPATPSAIDQRRLRVVAWYPAVAGTGEPARYLADLDRIEDGLVASGEVGELEAAGLGFVADPARSSATIDARPTGYPVVLLSPGNATNVEFYSALAEDLASHGFVVIGLDHPYQVAAVALDADVAVYQGDPPLAQAAQVTEAGSTSAWPTSGSCSTGSTPARSAWVRWPDTSIYRASGSWAIPTAVSPPHRPASTAGSTPASTSMGSWRGGPFSARPDPVAPTKPFMYLTKETELHPTLAALFEAAGADTFRAVVPRAAHDEFADPARFRPRVLPTSNTADDVITVTRGLSLAFFDHTLRSAPVTVFDGLAAPTDIQILVYPLIGRR